MTLTDDELIRLVLTDPATENERELAKRLASRIDSLLDATTAIRAALRANGHSAQERAQIIDALTLTLDDLEAEL